MIVTRGLGRNGTARGLLPASGMGRYAAVVIPPGSLSCTMRGSGSLSGTLTGLALARALMTGSGRLVAVSRGVGGLSVTMRGSSGVIATAVGVGHLSALIKGYGLMWLTVPRTMGTDGDEAHAYVLLDAGLVFAGQGIAAIEVDPSAALAYLAEAQVANDGRLAVIDENVVSRLLGATITVTPAGRAIHA